MRKKDENQKNNRTEGSTKNTQTLKAENPIMDYTDFSVGEMPNPQVRYTSGQMIYLESLGEKKKPEGPIFPIREVSDIVDSWVGCYWSADGRINVPNEPWAEEAFQLGIDKHTLSTGWKCVSVTELPKTEKGARHLAVELANTKQPIRIKVHTLIDGTPVMTRWLEITNTDSKPVALTSLSIWSGKFWNGQNFTLGYFTKDAWANEGWFEWTPIPLGLTRIICDKGQGHNDPFFIVRNEVAGEYFIGHLAWSANWEIAFRRDSNGLKFRISPTAVSALRVMAPGETIKTPAVHLGHVSGSLDTAVQAMQDHLRRFVLPIRKPERSCLIQYLVPADQGYYLPFDEESAIKCIDVAAAIGAELFLLDAYWWDVTCDWVPSANRFPHGLQPLIDYAHKKGLLFGLYVETEGGRGNIKESKAYKEHPDWFGPKDILNLTMPEAAAWMESEICRLIEEYKLDLYRLDYNPIFTYQGPDTVRDGIIENNYWRYYEVFYDLYEHLQKKYPDLILQQCAAGGARNDLGTVSRFHETYLTDGLVIPRELQSYSGQTLGLPPEIFVILHGADGGAGTGKPQNLDTVLRMTFSLSTPQIFVGTVAPSVKELTPHRRERFLHYANIYKHFIRPLLPTCKMYHHEPVNAHSGVESSPWFAVEFASPERTKGWATIIKMRNGKGDRFVYKYPHEVVDDSGGSISLASEDETYLFKPRGLDPAKTYRVTLDSLNTTVTVDGLRLTQEGLPIRLENIGMSELLLFEATAL